MSGGWRDLLVFWMGAMGETPPTEVIPALTSTLSVVMERSILSRADAPSSTLDVTDALYSTLAEE